MLYDNIQGTTPYCVKRVAVLNCWGKMRSWGNHMVHHAIYYKQNYSYFGIIEALSGAPFDVSFISFDDIRENKDLLNDFDVIINVGDADTAQSGGENWQIRKSLQQSGLSTMAAVLSALVSRQPTSGRGNSFSWMISWE